MYKLYSIPGTCSTGITCLLEKLEAKFEIIKREDVKNYSELVPTNQVPALKDGELLITEGAAIVLYLLERHQNNMLTNEPEQRAKFQQYLMFNYATLHPAYSKLFAAKRNLAEGPDKTEFLDFLAASLSKYWQIIDNILASQEYVATVEPSVIEYLLAVYTSWNKNFTDLNIELGVNVTRLVEQVIELPEFKQAYHKEGIKFNKTF